MEPLENGATEKLLERLEGWNKGILPSGNTADSPCFVQKDMPRITPLSQDQSIAMVVTQSGWTSSLVHTGVLWNMDNDTTMHALSECQLLFHTPQAALDSETTKTLHLLRYDTFAWFPVNRIFRPTQRFQTALDVSLNNWPKNPLLAWEGMCKIWEEFGFLWPQKIILGRILHVKKTYKTPSIKDRLLYLNLAKDECLMKLETLKASLKNNTNFQDEENTRDQWRIIKRNDVCPIHEFLPQPSRDIINSIINYRFKRISIHQSFKLRSLSTSGYLSSCSSQRLSEDKIKHTSHHIIHWNHKTETSGDPPQPFVFSAMPLETVYSTGSQYLWHFSWNISSPFSPQNVSFPTIPVYQPRSIRCSSQIFLSPDHEVSDIPSRKAGLTNGFVFQDQQGKGTQIHTDLSGDSLDSQMIFTRVSNHDKGLSKEKQSAASRLQALGFMLSDDLDILDSDAADHHRWTVEITGLGLYHDNTVATEEGLNADIIIGRMKPIIDGDIISLRQVLYLCSVLNSNSLMMNKNKHNLNSPTSPSQLFLQKFHNNQPPALDDSSPTLPIETKDQISLSFHNLMPRKRLTRRKGMQEETSLEHTLSSPSSTSSQSIFDQLSHPVLAKENSLISTPGENCWIIQLATEQEIQAHAHRKAHTSFGIYPSQESLVPLHKVNQAPTVVLNDISLGSNSRLPWKTGVIEKDQTDIDYHPAYPYKGSRLKAFFSSETLHTKADSPASMRRTRSFDSSYSHPANVLSPLPELQEYDPTDQLSSVEPLDRQTPQQLPYLARLNTYMIRTPDTDTTDVGIVNTRELPYLELHASKQTTKTWSSILRGASLARLGRLIHNNRSTPLKRLNIRQIPEIDRKK
ncbi:hypothetical protein J3Q64DRAFT_1863997 [Phycomyces blakesleeanus]|uniref:Uncharacterized protein n=2 Tax=Phycomyces blakesleeanus TaxID=4837 RepID=A0A163B561_PHYB8|nr:hypothetical protein PHYBLDRAFT_140419 [Phycomyces blakesleeanus NRRL 1555(-)]OAD78321.1 hypothetical protein PHYBLDRAFT_140419 [Phycomyces blakesleeanus NRRL 1555(-)]|eukprot:XP_018296361.1 hypothetical protein PHYBLDRAFT_140419 [Phycomyces blakesleeanus NRRL 1555(-)]